MSVTKPADLTLALQNATEGFTDIVDQLTDTDIIDIRQIILPVLMRTKYDKLALTYYLSGVILPKDRSNTFMARECIQFCLLLPYTMTRSTRM